jgi:hypothetical protein
MAGLLVSHAAPLGQVAFSEWLNEHRTTVGRAYANELQRHFASTPTAAWTAHPVNPSRHPAKGGPPIWPVIAGHRSWRPLRPFGGH